MEWGTNSISRLVCVLRSFPPKSQACKSQSVLVIINMGLVWSVTATLSSNVSTPCAGTLCRGWRTFLREHGSVRACVPAHLLGHGLWTLTFPSSIYHSPSPLHSDSHSLSFPNNSWVSIIFAFLRENIQTSPRDAKDMERGLKHQMFLCLWADVFHTVSSWSVEPFPVARTKRCNIWEAGGAKTEMLVWESPCYFSDPLL